MKYVILEIKMKQTYISVHLFSFANKFLNKIQTEYKNHI